MTTETSEVQSLFNHPNISSAEFLNPHKMDPELIIGLNGTRDWIKRPMSFGVKPMQKDHSINTTANTYAPQRLNLS